MVTGIPGGRLLVRGIFGPEHWDAQRDSVFVVGPRTLARAQGILSIAAGILGFVGVLLPHPSSYVEPGLVTMQAVAVSLGLVFLLRPRALPEGVIRHAPAIGTLMASFALYFSMDPGSPYAMFYVWIPFYAVCFLSHRAAILHVGWALANYGAVAAALAATPSLPTPGPDRHELILIGGTVLIAVVLLMILRSWVERLVVGLTDAARIDSLTGLRNRRGFQDALCQELERATPAARPLSVVIADIDHFKQVNERLGHARGDTVLQEVGRCVEAASRRIDTVARTGGEEFAVILPDADEHQAYLAAERLLRELRDRFHGRPEAVTLSVGIATFPAHGTEIDRLLRSADEAMHAAKALGRDRVVLYSSEVTSILFERTGRRDVEDQAHLATVLGLAEALDARDSSTAKHSQTVGHYAELMARELNLAPSHIERVRMAGVLHDIGKIGVPDAVLRKPGALNDEEWEQMRRHPEIGARILSGEDLDDIRGWILAHHERPDGHGYPFGLSADEIPLEARILAVADAYEAMTADRVYRQSLGHVAAQAELRRGSGTQFDERIVDAFLDGLRRQHPELVAVA